MKQDLENSWQRKLILASLRLRHWILALVIALSLAATLLAKGVTFDASIEAWFVDDDPALLTYREFLHHFEADELAVVGVFAKDGVFTPENLQTLKRITKACQQISHAHRVHSLVNVRVFSARDDAILIDPLFRRLPQTLAAAQEIKERALADPLLAGVMVSKDGLATVLVIELAPAGNSFAAKVAMAEALQEIADREQGPGLTIRLAGTPPLDAAFYQFSARDFRVMIPLTVLMVLLVSFLIFRRFSAALIPLTVVLLASLWCFGLMGLLGMKITVVSSALMAFVLAVGVADGIHILAEYDRHLLAGHQAKDAMVDGLTHLLVPCFFTSATTAAGLLSLLSSNLGPIRDFACLSAAGVGFAFLLSFTVVPFLLPWYRLNQAAVAKRRRSFLPRLLAWLGRPSRPVSLVVTMVALILLVLAIWPLQRIEVGPNPMNYFPADAKIRKDVLAIEEALGGTVSIELMVRAPGEGLKDPEVLRRMDDLQTWLEGSPSISRALSVTDSLKELNRLFHEGDPRWAQIPQSRQIAAQLYLLLEGEDDLERMVANNYSLGRISVRAKVSATKELMEKMPVMEARVAQAEQDLDLDLEVTGFINLMKNMEVYLLQNQMRSFLIAFAVITLMLMLLLRSVPMGLLSMIPNFVPVFLGLAFMGLVGIPLDPGTVMIGSIALGLVVDDSVHFLVRLRRALAGGQALAVGIETAIHEAGRPIVVTSLVLASGFAILLLGSFGPNIYFGLVSAIIILLALVADLILLPAVLLVLRPAKLLLQRKNQ